LYEFYQGEETMYFDSKNDGKWFYFEDDPAQGGICIRVLPIGESRRIDKLTIKTKYQSVRGQVVDVKTVNEEERDKLIWDYCIAGWQNIFLDGKSLECTMLNKTLMMQNTAFASFFLDKVTTLNDELMMEKDLQAKNLGNTSSGSAKPIVPNA
jgi:hypothetical protein